MVYHYLRPCGVTTTEHPLVDDSTRRRITLAQEQHQALVHVPALLPQHPGRPMEQTLLSTSMGHPRYANTLTVTL